MTGMSHEFSTESPVTAEMLIILDWRDGPVEGVLRRTGGRSCWYFKLLAERLEALTMDDRLFGLWSIADEASTILDKEFGEISNGSRIWPAVGGIGSDEVRGIVDEVVSAKWGTPSFIVRTPDFADVLEVWKVVPD